MPENKYTIEEIRALQHQEKPQQADNLLNALQNSWWLVLFIIGASWWVVTSVQDVKSEIVANQTRIESNSREIELNKKEIDDAGGRVEGVELVNQQILSDLRVIKNALGIED